MVIMVRSRLGWKLCRVDQKIEFFGHLGMGLEVLFAGNVVHRPVIVVFLQTYLLVIDC